MKNIKKIVKLLKEFPLSTSAYHLNPEYLLDLDEFSASCSIVFEYIEKTNTEKWYYIRDFSEIEEGPVIFYDLPTADDLFIRPESSDFWIPSRLLDFIDTEEKKELLEPVTLCTSESVHGCVIEETKGVVFGISRHKSSVFGEIIGTVKNLFKSTSEEDIIISLSNRFRAIDRIVKAARRKNCNAVISLRFNQVCPDFSSREFTFYGTAVRISKK
ncbi:MAG: hypothetical protein CSB55_05655 [Candidatus Cloacimonadota bacterium]|nr:MAG: hypothetical protein CSB55_05655 [Candidatus Cloacimonadota bacterium]